MSTSKSVPLTKSEVIHLLKLIESHPVVLSKTMNAANNQMKDNAWRDIAAYFNASCANIPRKPETLRLKWENLKKTARKRSARIRNNPYLKTEDTIPIPEYVSMDDALDRVAAILEPSVELLPATPKLEPATSTGKLKREPYTAVKTSQQRKNEAIAKYYEEKTKQEEEIFKLRKKKLELEIRELFMKIDT